MTIVHTTLKVSFLSIAMFATTAGCATYKQAKLIDEKVDQLMENTRRGTLAEIFGEQSTEITKKIEELDPAKRGQVDELMREYQKGATTLEEVRSGMVTVLGGGDREVASARGIWVRDEQGNKLKVVTRSTKLANCKRLADTEVPATITEKAALRQFTWGTGQIDGQNVVFPWELTMSSFAREIVENTAKRTAEEFMKLGGEKGWNRPIYIQVSTDAQAKGVRVNTPGGDNEIYLQNSPAENTAESGPGSTH